MVLNKYHIIRYLVVLFALFIPITLFYKCECSHYKIGPSGELGEITILRDYVIFGHHSSLFDPKSNYIRIPIEYDSSVLEIGVTSDSIIHIAGYPKITSYELSKFKDVDTTIGIDQQSLHGRVDVMRCSIITHGYGLYPTFYYYLPDSTIIRQEYIQRFPWESPDKWCYYDTIKQINGDNTDAKGTINGSLNKHGRVIKIQ